MPWRAPIMWEGGDAWIIGGGPSMPRQFGVPEDMIQSVMLGASSPRVYSDYLKPLHARHVIGINNAYLLGAWVEVVFFGDNSWYLVHRQRLAAFSGLKISCAPRFGKGKNGTEGIKYLSKDRDHKWGISSDPCKVSWNSNSGCSAISLAHHFGVRRIILLGFDMTLDKKGVSHWHGSHGKGKHKPPFMRHLKGFPTIARDAARMGIEILNASPDSAIKEFRKVKVAEILANT